MHLVSDLFHNQTPPTPPATIYHRRCPSVLFKIGSMMNSPSSNNASNPNFDNQHFNVGRSGNVLETFMDLQHIQAQARAVQQYHSSTVHILEQYQRDTHELQQQLDIMQSILPRVGQYQWRQQQQQQQHSQQRHYQHPNVQHQWSWRSSSDKGTDSKTLNPIRTIRR